MGHSGAGKIQVWIANLPGKVAEYIQQSLLQHLDQQLDLHAFDNGHENVDLLSAVSPETEVLILGADKMHLAPDICIELFSRYTDLKIIVMVGDGATTYWIRPRR